MKQRINLQPLHSAIVSILQFSILGIAIIILLILSGTEFALQLSQITRTSIPPHAVVSSPTTSNSDTISSLAQQTLAEAQNDVTTASAIITFAGVFVAIVTVIVALAGWFGVRELGSIQLLRTKMTEDFENKSQTIETLLTDLTKRT